MKLAKAAEISPVIRSHVVSGQVLFSTMLIHQNNPFPTLEQGAKIDIKTMDNVVFVGIGRYWSMVESVDVSTSNGVIHVINGVLGVTSGVNIYQALELFDSSKYGTYLNKMAECVDLKNDLMDASKMFTVFAPQNTAWDNVSTSEISTMEKVLKHHMIKGKLSIEELINKGEVRTVSGELLIVKKENEKVYLKFYNMRAEVTSTDNMASNGIIHAIDKVLRVTKPKSNSKNVSLALHIALCACIGLFFCLTFLFAMILFERRHSVNGNNSVQAELQTIQLTQLMD